MNSTIMTIYENGILRPLVPLALPERARVQVHVEQVLAPTDSSEHRRQVHEALIAAGLSLPTSMFKLSSAPVSEERRDELAHLFAPGRPLSELIIEERQGR
ncbi:MAG: antitoxin family protein [Thermoflexales bacterium]|nr:antitoxin family protein [Thermoflexales bacterium]